MEAGGPESVAALIDQIHQDGKAGLAAGVIHTRADRQKVDAEGEAQAAMFHLQLDSIITDADDANFVPYLDSGIADNAEWVRGDDEYTIIMDAAKEGAARGTALENMLKNRNKAKFLEEYSTDSFLGEDCKLWDDSPNLKTTGKPLQTTSDRCRVLAGLVRKWKCQRRHICLDHIVSIHVWLFQ